jgi:hypothetical protein
MRALLAIATIRKIMHLSNAWNDYELRTQQEASNLPIIITVNIIHENVGGIHAGPDAQRRHQVTLKSDHDATVHLDFFASELRLRGDAPVAQPHIHQTGDVLCWNGEVLHIHLLGHTASCSPLREDF